MSEAQRNAVLTEAREWLGTPYVEAGRVKGKNGGCDCLTFLAGVYENTRVIERMEMPLYPPDWHMNHAEEWYLDGKDQTKGMRFYCDEIEGPPLPADIVVWKWGHVFAHSAIVIDWPIVMHARKFEGVVYVDAEMDNLLARVYEVRAHRNEPRPKIFMRPKAWA